MIASDASTRPTRDHRRNPARAELCTGYAAALCLITRSFRRRHLDRAARGAAEPIGPIHVLYIGLRMDVAAGRDRAHHVGNREHRWIAALALECGAEAV